MRVHYALDDFRAVTVSGLVLLARNERERAALMLRRHGVFHRHEQRFVYQFQSENNRSVLYFRVAFQILDGVVEQIEQQRAHVSVGERDFRGNGDLVVYFDARARGFVQLHVHDRADHAVAAVHVRQRRKQPLRIFGKVIVQLFVFPALQHQLHHGILIAQFVAQTAHRLDIGGGNAHGRGVRFAQKTVGASAVALAHGAADGEHAVIRRQQNNEEYYAYNHVCGGIDVEEIGNYPEYDARRRGDADYPKARQHRFFQPAEREHFEKRHACADNNDDQRHHYPFHLAHLYPQRGYEVEHGKTAHERHAYNGKV